jgi:tetratricopeptide (TPR) repeat protein
MTRERRHVGRLCELVARRVILTTLAVATVRVLAAVLGVMVAGVALAVEEPCSLEHLLQQLEQAELAARPAINSESAVALRETIEGIVKQRNLVTARDGGFFNFLENVRQTSGEYRTAFQTLFLARNSARIAENNAAVQRELSRQLGKQTAFLAPAERALTAAQGKMREAEQDHERVVARLHAHDTRMHRDAPEFFRTYFALRELLPRHRDSSNIVIAETLAPHMGPGQDFIEGHVVSAIALVYAGNDDKAGAHLETVEATCTRYPLLLGTTIAEDWCATWLLMGRPDKVSKYIVGLRSIPEKQRTFSQEWLLAAHDSLRGQREKALKGYELAVGKTNPGEHPPLQAEAAKAALTGSVNATKIQLARRFLEGIKDDSQWSVLRARALLEAAEERWDEAVRVLDQATGLMPPCIAAVTAEQRDAYRNGKAWLSPGLR